MSDIIGYAFMAAGVVLLFRTWLEYRRQRRGTMITPELAELLATPLYVLRARSLARFHGYPESEWERFQHIAIADLIKRGH